MIKETLSTLRSQFLGLNRVLSTVTSLVTEGLAYDDEEALFNFAAKLLVNNHNFQFCAIHLLKNDNLSLACATSIDSILDPDIESEAENSWVGTCEHLARQFLERGDHTLVKRQAGDTLYYSMPIVYRDEILATLTLNSPSFDDNHPKLISIFCHILTSIVINTRQNQRLTQEVKRRTEELESAWLIADQSSTAKSQFLTNMSHEYLTPLNVIVGSGSLLSETILSIEQKDYVNSIMDSSDSLQAMVNAMLDYSMTETGKLEFNAERTNLHELLFAVRESNLHDAAQKGLELELLVASDLPMFVTVDGHRLSQVLNNLVSNAIKFTNSGRITIDTYCEPTGKHDAKINFSVLDTGIGIEISEQLLIFQAFHQIDSSNTRLYQGIGLGLAISQRIAKLLGSEIQVASKPNEGSRFNFSVTLPVEEDEAGYFNPEWSLPTQMVTLHDDPNAFIEEENFLNNLNVLLVEDNIINQKLAARLLEKMGCTVDIANDGADAVDMFRRSPYDVVFMDCQMPVMDGFEATTQIRALESGNRIPIIALTANSLPEDRAKSYKAGMDEFLTKPIVKEKLQNALTKWVQH